MYKFFIRPLLFLIDPEKIHHFTFGLLQIVSLIPEIPWILKKRFSYSHPSLERKILGWVALGVFIICFVPAPIEMSAVIPPAP